MVGQQRYAHDWAVNAEAYCSQGLYRALAKELTASGDSRRILDIGCGLGHGIDALLADTLPQGRTIIGIDENPECLVGAAERLGLPADGPMLRRLVSKRLLSGAYEITIKPGTLASSGERAALVNVDMMLPDPEFEVWLDKIGYFDAITLWFSGVHKARSQTKISKRLEIEGDEDHREVLQDKLFQFALRHLRPGGLVQIVTRVAGPDIEALREPNRQMLAAALKNWPFEVTNCTVIPYAEPNVPGAIQVKSKSFDASGMQTGALSMLVRARSLATKSATEGLFNLARRTPFNVAPEQSHALAEQIFRTRDWSVRPSETEANFYAVVDDKAIYLSYAGLASLWCLAYVVFSVIHLVSRLTRAPEAKAHAAVNIGQFWAEQELHLYLAYARRLFRRDEPWPLALNVPNPNAMTDSFEGRVNNLFFGALSWIMLHEIGHVHHKHERLLPAEERVRQEHQADDFATDWMLKGAGQGIDREFRCLMIITALAWLFLHEETKGQGSDHPPAIYRFRDAVGQFALGERSPALENAYYLLKALFDPANGDIPKRPTPRQAFDWITERLETLFPAQ
ncbi:SAM-dependent methyltransferase [Bradyrhizobium sp. I1.8.5]|uniref:phage exclusion protein Lit family protein n=1 Tax=Bradyrhizobium sp. I1.8.5 TaxID=3156365 RepID=UPI003394FB0B